MFDLGGTVDTLAFHEQYDEAARMYSIDAEQILPLLTPPYTAEKLGAAATHSALAHQRVVCKPQLPALLELGSIRSCRCEYRSQRHGLRVAVSRTLLFTMA